MLCYSKVKRERDEEKGKEEHTDGFPLAEPVENGARVGHLRHESLSKPGVTERLVLPTVLHLRVCTLNSCCGNQYIPRNCTLTQDRTGGGGGGGGGGRGGYMYTPNG